MKILDDFYAQINTMLKNSVSITNKCDNVTNEISVSNGKIDHIMLKLKGYNAALGRKNVDILGHTACRFGKWFSSISQRLSQTVVNEVSDHHMKVHEGLKKAIDIFSNNGNLNEGVQTFRTVENSSKVGFEKLIEGFKAIRKS